jgi:hypothetical protein
MIRAGIDIAIVAFGSELILSLAPLLALFDAYVLHPVARGADGTVIGRCH